MAAPTSRQHDAERQNHQVVQVAKNRNEIRNEIDRAECVRGNANRDDLGELCTRGSTAASRSATTSCLIVRAQERKSWRMIEGRMDAIFRRRVP